VAAGIVAFQILADIALNSHLSPLYQDGGEYHRLAVRLALHGTYGPLVAFRPPGWVFALAGLYRLFGPHPVAGLALNAICSGATALLVQRLGRRLGLPPLASLVAAIATGVFPWTLLLGATLYSETFFVLILVATALVVLSALDRPQVATLRWLAIGALAGLGALVRPAMLFWLPIGAWLALRRRPSGGTRAAAAFLVGVALLLGPWTVRNYARLHTFVPIDTAGGSTLAGANNDLADGGQSTAGLPHIPPGNEVQGDRAFRAAALHWIGSHPAGFVGLVAKRFVRSVDPTALLSNGAKGHAAQRWLARAAWAGVMVLAIVGVIRRHRGSWAVLLSLLVPQLVEIVLFGGGFRFLAPSVPFLLLLAVGVLGDTLGGGPSRARVYLSARPSQRPVPAHSLET